MKRPKFITGEIYHLYNRGVEKRRVFSGGKDYLRFMHDLYEFNDTAPASNLGFYFPHLSKKSFTVSRRPRELLVEILCFCLLPNHYHLLVRQRLRNGVTEFMRKLGTGYTNYFNKKYQRVGSLFQGKFKAIHVKKESHLLYLPHYIHLNPLDLFMPEWRESKIHSIIKALQYLKTYRWSSYLDYIKKKNFPSVTQRDFLVQIYGSPTSINYERGIKEWLQSFDMSSIQEVIID